MIRPIGRSQYEVLSGNQRIGILQEKGIEKVPCIIVHLDDSRAMLLAEALNSIRGDDDLALRGALFKKILSAIPQDKVLSLLPERAKSLTALSSIGQGRPLPGYHRPLRRFPHPLVCLALAHQESLRKGRAVKLGMEKARALGHKIGRPRVTDRKGFNRRFGAILERLAAQQVSRRRAAKELGIGYATLKRLIDAQRKQDGPAN